jgi:tetratricopeptide (TPR) repeat protein
LPSLPLIALASAGIVTALTRFSMPVSRTAQLLLLVTLGVLSWRQSHLYNDMETFYRTTIAKNPGCWMAYNNLGHKLAADKSRFPEAIELFERSIALRPTNAEALSNLGLALAQSGRPEEGIARLQEAVRINVKLYQAYNNLGLALTRVDRLEESIVAFARAAQLNPYLPQIHDNWAKVCRALGQTAEAEKHFAEAARLNALNRAP